MLTMVNSLFRKNLTEESTKTLMKSLTSIDDISKNVVDVLKKDSDFKKLFEEAIQTSGNLTDVRLALDDLFGNTTVTRIFSEIPIATKYLDNLGKGALQKPFIFTPKVISEIESAIKDPKMLKIFRNALDNKGLESVLDKAQKLVDEGKVVDSNWVMTQLKEYEKLPGYKGMLTSIKPILNWFITNKNNEKSILSAIKKIPLTSAGIYTVIAALASLYTSDELYCSWYFECMTQKGYKGDDAKCSSKDIKSNDSNLVQAKNDCILFIDKKESTWEWKEFKTWWPQIIGTDTDFDFVTPNITKLTTTYTDDLASFKKYMDEQTPPIPNSGSATEQKPEDTGISYKTYKGNGITYKFCKGNFITSDSECK